MWLFRPPQDDEPGDGDSQVSTSSELADDLRHSQDVEFLRSKALELQAKLDAIRAAEYREQLRASCEAHQALVARYGAVETREAQSPSQSSMLHEGGEMNDRCDLSSPVGQTAQHFQLEDAPSEDCLQDESKLEDMYDFSRFQGSPVKSNEGAESDEGVARLLVEVKRAQARETAARNRVAELESQVTAQQKKLSSAARAIVRTRSRVQQLTAQLGLKALEGSQLNSQVSQLRALLVDKEQRLQSALDDAEAAIKDAESFSVAAVAAIQEQSPQQPQEAPHAVDEAHMLQLAKITEELIDALEVAREAEDQAARQAEEAEQQLECERALRAQAEEDLRASKDKHGIEVDAILAHVAQQERTLLVERQRVKEAEERLERAAIEERLGQALRSKGKTLKFPHLEV